MAEYNIVVRFEVSEKQYKRFLKKTIEQVSRDKDASRNYMTVHRFKTDSEVKKDKIVQRFTNKTRVYSIEVNGKIVWQKKN
jgi:hypothetical protein